jgi:ABC-2 type transport system permease protein
MTMLLLVGRFGFGVPMNGDPLSLIAVILAGVAAFDALGLLIACRTEKTETASGLMNLCMLPMYLLSGTFFSSKRFPDAIQPLIQALPLTQVNDALREVMLEGASLAHVWWRVAILLVWTVVGGALALKWFRWR